MAGQPDISSILAALAQRPTPTQSAPPQQAGAPPPGGMPPGFPAHLGGGQTPNLGGYPLPQPSNSGSVDLSAIRPANTGSVSIADAIAKAKSIAADRGISYDNRVQMPPQNQMQRDDPRLAGRQYRRSRSRSRSPSRRDNFRDNYNPYRDERRDADRRDRGFPRDRSASPGPRGRGNFSPNPAGRDPRSPPSNRGHGGPGGDSDTINVKSALVGLIIGRNGENLRRVESETGARVQFIPSKEPNAVNRQCTISGPPRARDAAKREIFRVIDENGGSVPPERGPSHIARGSPSQKQNQNQQPALREGENSVQIMVPDKTVGLIIGRGGETIRDLQERSGCHVNIVGENKSINGMRPVNLIGSPAAATMAKEIILEIVESDTRAPGSGGLPPRVESRGGPAAFDPYRGAANDRGGNDKITEEIFVPSEAVGMIIGKGGETIKDMQATTGCKINVSQPQQPDVQRQIGLVGSRSAIEEAKRAIWDKVDTVQQRDRQGGREQRAPRNDAYGGNQYSQQQPQQSYGQPSMGGAAPTLSALPGMSATPQQSASGDSNAADPYAPYGGYQAYCAMWYAALAQQGGQGGQPQMPPQ